MPRARSSRMRRCGLGLIVAWAACAPVPEREAVAFDGSTAAMVAAPVDVAIPVDVAMPPEPARAIAPPSPVPIPAYEEQLGPIRLGMTIAELYAAQPTFVQDGTVVAIPPDGGPNYAIAAYGKRLKDEAADVSVELESPTADGVFRAATIWAEANATATTKRGIGIGAKRSAVKKAPHVPMTGDTGDRESLESGRETKPGDDHTEYANHARRPSAGDIPG